MNGQPWSGGGLDCGVGGGIGAGHTLVPDAVTTVAPPLYEHQSPSVFSTTTVPFAKYGATTPGVGDAT
eukprot:7205551-Prymnesium_polylepis.2